MTSGLYGIYNAQRALQLNQAGINLVSNNISNMSTDGYSKEVLDVSESVLDDTNLTALAKTQSGLGAQVDGVTRCRDAYLDTYYRNQYSTLSYYKELNTSVSLVEDMTNELGTTGIKKKLSAFYDAAQALSLNPADEVTRTNFVQAAEDVVTKFNQISSELTELRTTLVGNVSNPETVAQSKASLTVKDLNDKLKSLTELNKQIGVQTSQGGTPNGLLDKRDKLLDEISGIIPVTVTNGANNIVSLSINGTTLVKGSSLEGTFKVSVGDDDNPATVGIVDSDGNNLVANAKSMITSGSLGAILQLGGNDSSGISVSGISIKSNLTSLDSLAREFAREVNDVQVSSTTSGTKTTTSMCIDSTANPKVLKTATNDIFLEQTTTPPSATVANYANMTAATIRVNAAIINNPYEIAAASVTYETAGTPDLTGTGDGDNAVNMAQVRNKSIDNLGKTTTEQYLTNMVSNVGSQVSSVKDNYDTQSSVVDEIKTRRNSTSGVDLDEELTNLVKYQRAYEASAKIMTTVNEMLQKIISLGQ